MQKIVGHDWQDIQAMQSKTHKARVVDAPRTGDYGADPIGDGTFIWFRQATSWTCPNATADLASDTLD